MLLVINSPFNSNITKVPLRRVICTLSKFNCLHACKTLSFYHENQFRLIYQIYSSPSDQSVRIGLDESHNENIGIGKSHLFGYSKHKNIDSPSNREGYLALKSNQLGAVKTETVEIVDVKDKYSAT